MPRIRFGYSLPILFSILIFLPIVLSVVIYAIIIVDCTGRVERFTDEEVRAWALVW